jgi:hypothetical protein
MKGKIFKTSIIAFTLSFIFASNAFSGAYIYFGMNNSTQTRGSCLYTLEGTFWPVIQW